MRPFRSRGTSTCPGNANLTRKTAVLAAAMCSAALIPALSHAAPPPASQPRVDLTQGAAADPAQKTVTDPAQGAVADPNAALGSGWRASDDVLVTGAGDAAGFHVYVAREKDAFRWDTLVTLDAGAVDAGTWTGKVCVTGSGRYAVAVYAPVGAANRPAVAAGGASAAVIDLRSAKVTPIPGGVELAYFNPGCGPDDRVLLTRSVNPDNPRTDLLAVDAASGRVTTTRRVNAQLTHPVVARDGDYGIVHGKLVKVSSTGRFSTVATPGGQPFGLQATRGGILDLLTAVGERAVAMRYAGGRLHRLGSGGRTQLRLFGLAGGRNALVGDVAGMGAAGRQADLTTVPADGTVHSVSRRGHLLVTRLLAEGQRPAGRARPQAPASSAGDALRVDVRATRSGRASSGVVQTRPKLSTAARTPPGGRGARALRVDPPDPEKPPNISQPFCVVPRNDVRRQALQPSWNMVEWAVDQAVHGTLNVQRPANFLKTGQPAYRPQTMFPPLPNTPKPPAQLLLAVLAQETNLAQASWRVVPGDGGNPLISDYYGTRSTGSIRAIDYDRSDCGYGIGQVTDGMAGGPTWTAAQQVAIATDYAANIAASMRILQQKWNDVRAAGIRLNDSDPTKIENWYGAVWGYNSGVHPNKGTGNYGLGWFNNPANPRYPPREGFLRYNPDDASHPNDWAYPERIMGWAETPQWYWDPTPGNKYSKPIFADPQSNRVVLPDRFAFCGGNACDPGQQANPCPVADERCWWHGQVTWEPNCATKCTVERLAYPVGAAEPAIQRWFQPTCTRKFTPTWGPIAVIVDDLTDSDLNILGCPRQPWGGKFTLRLGDPSGGPASYYGQVDLHQLGAGYLGHSWFTHVYPARGILPNAPITFAGRHKVVATWTPDIPEGDYEIVAHIPSHRGSFRRAQYLIQRGVPAQYPAVACTINQATGNGTDRWVSLGGHRLSTGASVQLSNIYDDTTDSELGTTNIAFDAIAFVRVAREGDGYNCGHFYPY